MKRIALVALPLVLLVASGCASSQAKKKDASPAKPAAAAPMTAEEELKYVNTSRALAGLPPLEKAEPTTPPDEWLIFDDKATGRRLQRIPKGQTLRVENGKLRHTLLNPNMFLLDLVREDEKYYYVDAPKEPTKEALREADDQGIEGLNPLIEAPEIEYEVVAPPQSKTRLRFEEKSEGLPTSGFWRSNMKVADLDGNGSPEIVTPPPRLSAIGTPRIFRFDGTRWTNMEPQKEDTDIRLRFGEGGISVADVDGDGRPDVIGIGHGAGPLVALNKGEGRFRFETRGLPREMSGRAIEAGDIDGDGLLDVVAVSDDPESIQVRKDQERAEARGKGAEAAAAREAGKDGYRKGFDTRAFFGRKDGTFSENSVGLENACFGYSLALAVRPAGGGAPFFASGCRYQGGRALLYEWDAAAKAFRQVGRGVVEEFSFHSGSATGTYHGFPAAFAAYVKGNAPGAVQKPIRGHGVSIYYRDSEGWKRKRLVKVLADAGVESAGLGVGDLNGDGLDDVVWADRSVGRVRVFFQTAAGEFEELDPALQPRFVNHSMSVVIADVDRDGRNDIVLMFEYRTTDKSRAGGVRFFRNLG